MLTYIDMLLVFEKDIRKGICRKFIDMQKLITRI